MEGAVGDISSNLQQGVAAAEAALHNLYKFLRGVGVYVPSNKTICSWIHWAYCMAVTLSVWYLFIRINPILWSDQYDAMDKVWYIGTYCGLAAIVTWIFATNKRNVQLLNATKIVIKTLPETSCQRFTKWCKICFIVLVVLSLCQLVGTVLAIVFEVYTERLYIFLLHPFSPGELDRLSESLYLFYVYLTYSFMTTMCITNSLMLIAFTKISCFAFQNNFDQLKKASSNLPELSDLTSHLLDEQTSSVHFPNNSDGLGQLSDNPNATGSHPQHNGQIQHQGNNHLGDQLLSNQQAEILRESTHQLECPNSPVKSAGNSTSGGEEIAEASSMAEQSITTEEGAGHLEEHANRITQADLEACRIYHENISEYVSTIDAFYHFPTGVSLILGTFVACISLYYIVNATTEEDINFLFYLLAFSSFILVICLHCGVATDTAVSIIKSNCKIF